ncbi:unnamed protein product [Oppiella nova]|uniref:Dipeptidase E n=1 Tax=Oppiella nova TaxID=334625 RepID=A0A7R9R0C7_9ACAR|nr:unnamed protein product [Oppiella nova]CAG2180873.1 unnamed protein product [Oppiella nova]
MSPKRLLLLSNSTMSGTDYMLWSKQLITKFLTKYNVKNIVFIPFAGVSLDWEEYEKKVSSALTEFTVTSIHRTSDYLESILRSEAIVIGGGNSFHLLYKLQEFNLIDAIRQRVLNDGVPYVGWSAGANVATPDIGTTNDMPIIWPKTDSALHLVDYNINPHYNEWKPSGHGGETRTDRLNECLLVKKRPIVAISEGIGIEVDGDRHTVIAPELQCGDRYVKIWLFNGNNDTNIEVINAAFGQDIGPIVSK